jgi:hypothetical protein
LLARAGCADALRVASLSRHAALARAIAGDDALHDRARHTREAPPRDAPGFGFVAAANAAAVRLQVNGATPTCNSPTAHVTPETAVGSAGRFGPATAAAYDEDLDEFRRHPLDAYVMRRAWLGTQRDATGRIMRASHPPSSHPIMRRTNRTATPHPSHPHSASPAFC